MTDEEIDAVVRAGLKRYPYDPAAFRPALDALYPPIRRFIAHSVRDAERTEDVVQDTFAAMYRGLPGFRFESSVRTWLYRIALNEARSSARKTASRARTAAEYLQQIDRSGLTADGRDSESRLERDMLVHQILGEMTEKDAQALRLQYFEELPVDDIAAVLGIGVSATKMRLARARDRFARLWNEKGRSKQG